MWFTIGFAGACLLGCYVWLDSLALWLAGAGIALAIGAAFLPKRELGRRLCALLLGFGIGIGYFFAYDAAYTEPIRRLDGQTAELDFVTYNYSQETDFGSSVDCWVKLEGKQYRVRLYLDSRETVEPWTSFHCKASVRLTTDGGRSEPTFHRSMGILALCYQRGEMTASPAPEGSAGTLVKAVAEARLRILGILEEAFDGDTGPFARALLLGDRSDIDYATNTDFRISGISHVVAVSGLHVSILFALICRLTSKRRYLLALLGIPAIVVFMALANFTASVTRAGIMQIMMILALCVNREYDPPTALAFAVLAMLAGNPLTASGVGFQMSVGSVAGIFLFYDPISQWIGQRIPVTKKKPLRRLRAWFLSGVSVTLAAQIVTTPLVAYYYRTISLIGIVTNLAVLWVVSFIFYGVMLVLVLGFFSMGAASAAAWVIGWPIRYVLGTAHLLASVPLAGVFTASVYIMLWLVFCYALILVTVFRKDRRPLIALSAAALGLCVSLLLSWSEPLLFDHRVTVLDVGQGQCIILQHRGKTFLVDCGGDYAQDAADIAAETLLSMGIHRIDGLILSHYDADHAGGVPYLMTRIEADTVFLPVTPDEEALQTAVLEAAGASRVIYAREDTTITSDGMTITLYAPENPGSDNESCIAVLFQTEKCDTLICNDMSGFRERLLIRRVELPDVEVLVVGHHGSGSSTSEELLDAVRPETAIVSVGENNRYGHPARETLDRLEAAGCEIFRTDLSGDIIYRR